ncbi:hypothetical protein [Lysobacter sp. cf310]|uniref:hypothetical protein n=1 Tax=Lysobacter sp. cf310 TaxID=1761790 RepID=UPI0008E86CD9|nr:hypothetical protein [Lysobacter sp. cf310]SFK95956.1 hypothetical protein SAMN04487938_2644 [Lysobacter sp. cf310]
MCKHTPKSIARRLDDLAERMPQLVADHPDEGDFWAAYVRVSAPIVQDAGAVSEQALEHAQRRLDALLAEHDKIGSLAPSPDAGSETVPDADWLSRIRKKKKKRLF